MAAIKPIVLVNETDSPIFLQRTRPATEYRKRIYDGDVVEEPYEVRKPDERLEIPPTLSDEFDPHGKPGYVVMKSGTWGRWTAPGAYPDFEDRYASGRRPWVRILRGSEAERFVDTWAIDVDTEAK